MALQQKFAKGPDGSLTSPTWDDEAARYEFPLGYVEIDAEEYERLSAEREEALAADLAASRAEKEAEALRGARAVYEGLKDASPEAALVMARQVHPDYDPEEN